MVSLPLQTLGPTITATGIAVPPFEQILASLQTSYQQIYGSDVDLSEDTQDGAWIAIQAQAIYDQNDAIVTVYNSFSPTYAQGTGLSSLVKLNGLQREIPSFSTVTASVVGQAGIAILSGIAQDASLNQWNLPANITIPNTGNITVTLTCASPGNIALNAGTLLTIVNNQPGWQSVTTITAAQPGNPVENDATLRQRQSVSTSLPAQSPLAAILAGVANIPGVGAYAIYENDTLAVNYTGLPAHSIAVVVEGGNAQTIAQTIQQYKIPGCGTYGSTSVVVIDQSGVPDTINFFYLSPIQIYFTAIIVPLVGYNVSTSNLIALTIVTAITSLAAGQNVQYEKMWSPANLSGTAAINASITAGTPMTQAQLDQLSSTYEITSLYIGTVPNPLTTADISVPFNGYATTSLTNGNVLA